MHTLFATGRDAHDRGIADAGNMIEHALDVFREHVQPLGRHDHLFLAAADEELTVGRDLPDVAGMEPAVDKGACRLVRRVEIAGGDVLAADQDFSVRRDLHFDAGDGFPHRAFLRAERMIEAHDRRRFREPVALHHDEPELIPEGFELWFERCGADDEAPELETKQPMDPAVVPPAHPPAPPVKRPRGCSSGAPPPGRSTSRIWQTRR